MLRLIGYLVLVSRRVSACAEKRHVYMCIRMRPKTARVWPLGLHIHRWAWWWGRKGNGGFTHRYSSRAYVRSRNQSPLRYAIYRIMTSAIACYSPSDRNYLINIYKSDACGLSVVCSHLWEGTGRDGWASYARVTGMTLPTESVRSSNRLLCAIGEAVAPVPVNIVLSVPRVISRARLRWA